MNLDKDYYYREAKAFDTVQAQQDFMRKQDFLTWNKEQLIEKIFEDEHKKMAKDNAVWGDVDNIKAKIEVEALEEVLLDVDKLEIDKIEGVKKVLYEALDCLKKLKERVG